MVMASKNRFSYQQRLFLMLLVFSWVLVGCFVLFQYEREKRFKAEQLDARLQLLNMRLLDAAGEGVATDSFIARERLPYEGLRISVIDLQGRIVFDNSLDSLPTSNHLDRPEIADAMRQGTGYTIRRHSLSTDCNYFYSAMKGRDVIVRSAVPYTVSLQEVLTADRGFLWFMLGVTLLMSLLGYFATRRIGRTIRRLNQFAERAEEGERIYDDDAFPHDELGEISNHIIRLYARLQKAIADRDHQHELALHEEQEKIRIKKQLTNNINHELKTPVASIQICLETLLAHPDLPEEKRRDFMERCYANSERLRRLLDDVSTITRMDEGGELIQKEPVVLNDLIEELADEVRMHPGWDIDVSLPERLEICGSPSLLASIFRNLTDNAIAYSEGHRITVRLLENTSEWCKFVFADDGKGVAPQHLPHLFERFYRVDKGRSRKMGGTGLGLAIVKNAVMMHGGTIRVANRPEGGLEFVFTLKKGK